jgi:hypothetical protein
MTTPEGPIAEARLLAATRARETAETAQRADSP